MNSNGAFLFITGGNAKKHSHFGRHSSSFFQKKTVLPYSPTIGLLSIYPSNLKTYVHTKTCTHLFIAVLFIVAKT